MRLRIAGLVIAAALGLGGVLLFTGGRSDDGAEAGSRPSQSEVDFDLSG